MEIVKDTSKELIVRVPTTIMDMMYTVPYLPPEEALVRFLDNNLHPLIFKYNPNKPMILNCREIAHRQLCEVHIQLSEETELANTYWTGTLDEIKDFLSISRETPYELYKYDDEYYIEVINKDLAREYLLPTSYIKEYLMEHGEYFIKGKNVRRVLIEYW